MEIFDSLEQHLQRPQVLQPILSLMDRGTMVLTTNYDNLLELFGRQQNRPMESLDLKDKAKVSGPLGAGAGERVSAPWRRPRSSAGTARWAWPVHRPLARRSPGLRPSC